MPGSRSPKSLTRRIDLDYINHPLPGARLLRVLSFGLPAFAGLAVVLLALAGRESPYSAGPIAESHAFIADDCGRCHTIPRKVPDEKCLACHEGPVHRANQVVDGPGAPGCSSCHQDHGHVGPILARTSDSHCTRCHADLVTTSGAPKVTRSITEFATTHPEFAMIREAKPDSTRLKLKHSVHSKRGLKGVPRYLATLALSPKERERDHLRCTDCHPLDRDGRRMVPIRYQKVCATCHPLEFDARIRKDDAPKEADVVVHGSVKGVHRYVLARLAEWALTHPDQAILPPPPGAEPPPPGGQGPPPPGALDWVMSEVESIESGKLLSRDCKRCHEIEEIRLDPQAPLPYASRLKIVPVAMPDRWFSKARFSHGVHRSFECLMCHPAAARSQSSADVLVPGIAICRQCHGPRKGSRSDCVLCHIYHDKSNVPFYQGRVGLTDLLGRR